MFTQSDEQYYVIYIPFNLDFSAILNWKFEQELGDGNQKHDETMLAYLMKGFIKLNNLENNAQNLLEING